MLKSHDVWLQMHIVRDIQKYESTTVTHNLTLPEEQRGIQPGRSGATIWGRSIVLANVKGEPRR
jgi:hypothetical protein